MRVASHLICRAAPCFLVATRRSGGFWRILRARMAKFDIRRLDRGTGAVALGAFAVVHLVVQASVLGGAATYRAIAGSLAARVIELAVGLPLLLVAAVYLVRVLVRSKDDAEIERYGSARSWMAQRVSAGVIALFAFVHLWEFPIQRLFFGLSADAVHTRLTAHLSWTAGGIPWMALVYLVGIFAVVFHMANGVLAAIGPDGPPLLRRLTLGLGVLVFVLGAASVVGPATGTRLLSDADGDSATPGAACGTDAPPKVPVMPAPSR